MTSMKIRDLFALDIERQIEEVIKVDQNDEQIVYEEISEYIVTDSISEHYRKIFNRYWETLNKPHEGIGIWVSGFFGSGKSSFAKMLGIALENRSVKGQSASDLFSERIRDDRSRVLLAQIAERIPTDSVIFDLSTDRGIKSGNQSVTEIMYKLFLKSLGYAEDLDLAELEISLEKKGELDTFKAVYQKEFEQGWDENKDLIAFSLGEASAVMHKLHPKAFSTPDSWCKGAQDRADISAGKLAERCKELMARRRPERNLVFVVDEVGQFVSRDVQKMLDLQGVVQSLGRVSRGKVWLIVTSQEKLTELVSGLDSKQVELARLMDRFQLQVHLEPSDISEVTSKRVLEKNAEAEKVLRELYSSSSGSLVANTRLSADVKLAELSAQPFIDLYPLLPYQVELIIEVVSGLRTQGGASKHVGGANRTIIKLAQQLLIHDAVGLAGKPIGALVRIDQIYDLVSGNIPSQIRGKINTIAQEVEHPMAQSVAKAICLLSFVKNIHRTAENIAAALQESVDGDSALVDVKQALEELISAHKVRLHEGQYRIPSPAEDDWEVTRIGIEASTGEVNRLHADVVRGLWEPKPSHNLENAKVFKAGLSFNGRVVSEGDIRFNVDFEDSGADFKQACSQARVRSQSDKKEVFWVVPDNEQILRTTIELHRSKELLNRKERGARTKDESALVSEEKVRLRRHEGELKGLIRDAMLAGSIYFRGNDRSPDEGADNVAKAAARTLGVVLPDVYHRFSEGAALVSPKDLAALIQSDNLRGLPSVFTQLNLLRDENGQPVFNVEAGPLKEVLERIENKTSYGETANGKFLIDSFAKEPFGWNLDVVRLLAVSLVRSGLLTATSGAEEIDSVFSMEARAAFSANNSFRSCSFKRRVTGTSIDDWIEANEGYKSVFGKGLPELQAGVVARKIKEAVDSAMEGVGNALDLLRINQLPGSNALQQAYDQMKLISKGSDDSAIISFNASFRDIGDVIKRGAELNKALTDSALTDYANGRKVLSETWPALQQEPGLDERFFADASLLEESLSKESFFKERNKINRAASNIQSEYDQRFEEAINARANAYQAALGKLHSHPAWGSLKEDQQAIVGEQLLSRAKVSVEGSPPISLLRSELSACQQHYKFAVQQMVELIEGNSLITLSLGEFFDDRIETPEQLDAVLVAVRQRVEKLLGEGKKVLVQ